MGSHDSTRSAVLFVHAVAFCPAVVFTGICEAKHLVSPETGRHSNVAGQGIKNIGQLVGRVYVLQLVAN